MGHSIGISDSYYRITENELLEDYLKVADLLLINKQTKIQKELQISNKKNQEETYTIKERLQEKDEQIQILMRKQEQFENMIQTLIDSD